MRLLLALLLAAPASATNVELCFQLEVDFRDGHVGDWTDTTMTAHGVRVRITNNATGAETYYWADVDSGCFTASLSSRGSYHIRMLSKAKVTNDNIVDLRHSDANPVNFGWTAASSFTPFLVSSATYTWPTHPGGSYTERVSNIVAAGAWSLRRRYGGLSNKTLRLYKEQCGSGGSCLTRDDHGNLALFLSDSGGTRNKFQISHELGHLIGAIRDGYEQTNSSGYGLYHEDESKASACADGRTSDGATFNHSFDSEEWATAAASEGMAHFYAAAAWNWPGESDCKWYSYYDGSIVDCENGSKYLTNTCHGGDFPWKKAGSELDWLRFWWDAHSDCDIAFGAIMDIWDAANPRTWKDKNVVSRLRNAADDRLGSTDLTCFENKMRFNGVLE